LISLDIVLARFAGQSDVPGRKGRLLGREKLVRTPQEAFEVFRNNLLNGSDFTKEEIELVEMVFMSGFLAGMVSIDNLKEINGEVKQKMLYAKLWVNAREAAIKISGFGERIREKK